MLRFRVAGLAILGLLAHCSSGSPEARVQSSSEAFTSSPYTQQQVLTDPTGQAGGGGFASAAPGVAVDGDTLAVCSAHGQTSYWPTVFVYERVAGVWAQRAEIPGVNEAGFCLRGLALHGDTLVVHGDASTNAPGGGVHVYTRTNSVWTHRALLLSPDTPTVISEFGKALAYDGTTLVVGDPTQGASNEDASGGAAYIFTGAGAQWTHVATLHAADPGDRWFGLSIAVDGDNLIVHSQSAPLDAQNGRFGVVSAFRAQSGTWVAAGRLQAPDALPSSGNDLFGRSMSLQANRALFTDYPHGNGAAYVLELTGGAWTQVQELGPYASLQVLTPALDGAVAWFGHGTDQLSPFTGGGSTWTALPTIAGYFPGIGIAASHGTVVVASADPVSQLGQVTIFTSNAYLYPTCASTPCTPASAITVGFMNMPGNASDAITLAEADSDPASSVATLPSGGTQNGSVTFVAPPPGTYVVRGFTAGSSSPLVESAPFAVVPNGGTPTLALSCTASPCTRADTVTVTFANMPGYAADWIAIAPQGSPAQSYAQYKFTNGAVNGTVTFTDLPEGVTLVARAFSNNSYQQVGADSAPLTMIASAPPALSVACTVSPCTSSSAATVTFSGLAPLAYDWIAIAPEPSDPGKVVEWKYTDGAPSGQIVFPRLPPGRFVARAFQSNAVVAESAAFDVASAATPTLIARCAPDCTGQSVVVDFTNMPGFAFDRLALVQSGRPDAAYDRSAYGQGQVNGTVTFGVVPPGTYEVRAFADNSETHMTATGATFTVTGALPTPTISVTGIEGHVVHVAYAGMAGYRFDFLTIAATGAPDEQSVASRYTYGESSGTIAIAVPSGSYVLRAYFDDTFAKRQESPPFTVP